MPRDNSRKFDLIEKLKTLSPADSDTVVVPITDLHAAAEHAEHAVEYLLDFIMRKCDEQGISSLDEAAEKSPDLCELQFLLEIVEETGFALRTHVSKSLVAGELTVEGHR